MHAAPSSEHGTPRWASAGLWWERGGWFLPAFVVIVLMRWRFVGAPITADEGGYLAEARAWGRGAVLYRDVWVDRPQGLLLMFWLWDAVGLGSPEGVRLLALLACAVGAASCGVVAGRLVGPSARPWAAVGAGVFASLPQAEGFIANSESLSCSVGALALAVLVCAVWGRHTPSLRGIAAAGFLGACAFSVKQSGLDAVGAGMLAVTAICVWGSWTRRARVLAVPCFLAGFAVPLALMALHGAVTGWDRWWYAMYGYRADQRSALKNADWQNYHDTSRVLMPILWPAIIVMVIVAVWLVWQRRFPTIGFFVLWLGLAVFAFMLGGQFFFHYWVIFGFPIGTTVGALVSRIPLSWLRAGAAVVVLWSPFVNTVRAVELSDAEVGLVLSNDGRLVTSEQIGEWFESRRKPGEEILALCASAALYGNVDTDPPYPYLWFALIPQVPGARDRLVSLMVGDDAPAYVAGFQPARLCDPSGAIQQSLDERYRVVTTVNGIAVYQRI